MLTKPSLTHLKYFILITGCLILSSVSRIHADPEFIENKHYFILNPNLSEKPGIKALEAPTDPDQIQVLLFFSYACYGCYHLHPMFLEWQETTLGKSVQISRFPVSFNWGWANLARAYYLLEKLGLNHRLDSVIYHAIFEKQLKLGVVRKLREFLLEENVSYEKFDTLFSSFPIEQKVYYADLLTNEFGITVTPTVIIKKKNRFYRTDPSSAGGGKEFFDLLNQLIRKLNASK